MKSIKFSVAPMLDWTDRHCRYFYRVMSKEALLYSEMVTTGAILYGDRDRHLYFEEAGPVALQLGGSDPEDLAKAAKIGEAYGYSEINLNCGCPSDRVQKGSFGACLMAEPDLVAECYSAMAESTSLPVTIKTRIGIDHEESYQFLANFIDKVSDKGCHHFILHARKAWLSGLSPKENREIPPLNYERVFEIKRNYPHLEIALNGGVQDLAQTELLLGSVDSVMVGRSIYHNPYQMAHVDQQIFEIDAPIKSRYEIIMEMEPYITKHINSGGRLNHIVKHMLGLFHEVPRSRLWRRYLSENMHREGADFQVVLDAYRQLNA
ncbi:tRNA dihydrouridine(20/20a) synthase DusA [Ignatzschineria indica]|uniref:tRNA dihydrouridine(20/20a) synthase DusA n=1 Tax=Ignatzschineria indica TaxID=472583 RepID=UPI002574F859|nr:tRNA dihydrouridine(20/20a) synthase DusA [Ignatzschineria indica]MDM1544863.1 tRNA dihydrouridine(20/20a) synthase DusA [Ignatzschineria indica]